MAHYAQLDESNIVIQVCVITNEDEQRLGEAGVEAWLRRDWGGTWKKTSYNGRIRKNYAGIGYTYNSSLDAFIPPQPAPDYVLDTDTCTWRKPNG